MRPAWLAVLFLLPTALALAGCGGGEIPVRRPLAPSGLRELPTGTAPAPTTFTAGARRFAIDLSAALTLAGAGSYEIAIARERTNEAAGRTLRSAEAFVPTFGPVGSFRAHDGRVWRSTGQFADDIDKQAFFGGVGGAVRFDVAGSILGALAAAQREDASREALAATRGDVQLAAASGYFDLVGRDAEVDLARQRLSESREFLRERESFLARGSGLRVDVLRARAEVAQEEQALTVAEAAARSASIRLATTLGIDPSAVLVPVEARPGTVSFVREGATDEQLVAEAMERRPEIREAEALARAAREDESAATWGPLFPGVEVSASQGTLGFHPSGAKETDDFGVVLGWRIGPGGLLDLGAMRETRARTEILRLELGRRRERIAAEVVEARLAERSARARMRSAADGVIAAEEALRLSRERLRQGVAIALEVLDAERVAARARVEDLEATVAFDEAAYRLLRAIGEPPEAGH